ncbi:lipopolysaccharide biosynthesis protein [Aeromonas dhakensis]|uniref:lipopolysaccharide biosynthesis protein n=1 Tax=Aeromonas dhakensis TaxID=196024 RepID=UPI0039889ADC
MANPLSSTNLSLKKAFSFSALESIGSRFFDFIALWIVLNTLPQEDLAKFGLATASIFIFNLLFFAPETAMFKYFKEWQKNEELSQYLSSFFQFSLFKLLIHYLAACVTLYIYGDDWFFYAVIFSLITQNIQLAEISRIFFRLTLRQDTVAKYELITKITLCLCCIILFYTSSIEVYFLIYFIWSVLTSLFWFISVRKLEKLELVSLVSVKRRIVESSIGFSFWSHISGILTYYVYNGNILFLEYYNASIDELALYTVVNKVANLFFVIPMFFQSFVPVVLTSQEGNDKSFVKLLSVSAIFSCVQFLFFIFFGKYLASFFGVSSEQLDSFYQLGLILCSGVLFLNITRPLSTYLMIKYNAMSVMKFVFMPTAFLASILYSFGTKFYGLDGASVASSLAYLYMSISLVLIYVFYRKRVKND